MRLIHAHCKEFKNTERYIERQNLPESYLSEITIIRIEHATFFVYATIYTIRWHFMYSFASCFFYFI